MLGDEVTDDGATGDTSPLVGGLWPPFLAF